MPKARLLLVLFLLTAQGSLAAPAAPSIKCYKNEDGVQECGSVVPPEHAQKEIEMKSRAGLTTQRKERAKSAQEMAAEQAAAAAREKAERDAKAQDAANQVLLQTFSSEEDITLARDSQISGIKAQIKLTESRMEKLEKSLDQMIAEAADAEKHGKPIGENLTKAIETMRTELAGHRKSINEQKTEINGINARSESDLKRFRELRGHAP